MIEKARLDLLQSNFIFLFTFGKKKGRNVGQLGHEKELNEKKLIVRSLFIVDA